MQPVHIDEIRHASSSNEQMSRLLACETAPKHEDNALTLLADRLNDRIGERLPTERRMRIRLMRTVCRRGFRV